MRFLSAMGSLLIIFVQSFALPAQPAAPAPDPTTGTLSVGLIRPDMVDLAGEWNFREDPKDVGLKENWSQPGNVRGRQIQVPLTWQLGIPELDKYTGVGWYEKTFVLPASYAGKRIVLASHGIASSAQVWLNGQAAGEKQNVAQSPFVLDVTALARPGSQNTITIRVLDPPGGVVEYMLGGMAASGLWKEIWIEASGKTFIANAFMKPDLDRSTVVAQVSINAPPAEREQELKVSVTCSGPNGGKAKGSVPARIVAGSQASPLTIEIPIRIRKVAPWSPETPNLYQAEVTLTDREGRLLDRVSTDFGMRKLESRNNQVWLNNKPYYLLGGGLDPQPYGGGLDVNWHYPPPHHPLTDAEIQNNIRMIKSLGVNFVRSTLRPAPPRFLYWADRMGLLVWEEMWWFNDNSLVDNERSDFFPTGKISRPGFDRFKSRSADILLRDRNHPSLAMVGLFNEGVPFSGNVEEPLGELYRTLKQLAPSCFILDSSGGRAPGVLNFPENHPVSDIQDVHTYPSFHHFSEARDMFTGYRACGKPVLVTEFGTLPYIFNVDKFREKWPEKLPVWATGAAGCYASYFPPGYDKRFYRWGLDEVFGSFKNFADACDWYYYEGFKINCEQMRLNPELSGFVAWIYDSAPHATGIIDFFWDKKVFADEMHKIWSQNLIIPDIRGRRNFWTGETVRVEVHASHYGDDKPLAGEVHWRLDGTPLQGNLGKVAVPAGTVTRAGLIEFKAPDTSESRAARLVITWERKGKVISENYLELYFYPISYRAPVVPKARFGADIDARRFLTFGYQKGGPLVTTRLDSETTQALQNGDTVILLPGPTAASALRRHGLVLASRDMSNHTPTCYLRKNPGLFGRIPFGNPLMWPFQAVWPQKVICGVKEDCKQDMLGGMFGSMISGSPADENGDIVKGEVFATLLQTRCGKGRLIISTFDLLGPYIDDPVAMIMLNDLIAYANKPFEPVMSLKP